jgi:hypothetical protein
MKRRFSNTILAGLATATAAALPGCVAEDYGDCPDLRLLVRTDHEVKYGSRADGRTTQTPVEAWYDCIDAVCVYIFDENLHYVGHWDGPALTWNSDYEVPLRQIGLTEGIYTFVVWTNHNQLYSSNEGELGPGAHIDRFVLRTGIPQYGEMTQDLTHRHYGILERVHVSNNSIADPRMNTIVIDPTVHNINFTASGLADNEGGWSLTVSDSNRTHDFGNKPIDGEDEYRHTHTLDFGEDDTRAGELRAGTTSMMLQQLHDATPTIVTLTDETTGGEFYSTDLVRLIERVYGMAAGGRTVDFERTLEFDVTLNFSEGALYSVTVNGWTYRLNDNELF